MWKKSFAVAATIGIALMSFMPSQAAVGPAHTDRIAYLVSVDSATYTDLLPVATPAGQVAPLGYFSVHPSGTSFTFNVDDLGSLDGTLVPVTIYGHNAFYFDACTPVRTTTTVTGAFAGDKLTVVMGDTHGVGHPCFATAGLVTVTGVV